jgi:lysophospholipase L1-like esterase
MRDRRLGIAFSIVSALLAGACSGDQTHSPSEPAEQLMSQASPAPRASRAANRSLRYLALGDSYTIGEGVSRSDTWPVQLAELIRQQGTVVGEPQIIARTGWTVAELEAALDAGAPKGPFDLVTLLIGVNDQYRGGDPETYRPQLTKMLARAVALAGASPQRVVVLSIPDWGVTPFAQQSGRRPAEISAAIDHFNAVAQEETARAGVWFVDVTTASRRAGTTPALRAPDGLHYSREMYGEWAALALPDAAQALANPAARKGKGNHPKAH